MHYFLMHCCLMFVSHFFAEQSFLLVVLDRFFCLVDKKMVAGCVGQVVVLYSHDCMGICLGGLNIGRLKLVVVL